MSIVQSSAPSWVVSRRAVVIAACAGAVAVTADGLVSRTVGGGDAPTGTAAAAGLVATSFGSLRVLQLVRDRRPGLTTGDHALDAHGEAGNHTWAGRVALQLEVHNATPAPVLFSPGQVRLQVGDTGIGVTPEYASRLPGPLAAGGLEQLWVRYLTPSGTPLLRAELSDPYADRVLQLALPPAVSGGPHVHSEHAGDRGHGGHRHGMPGSGS